MTSPSVAERNRELWQSWIQSPYINVACPGGEIRIPRELLRRRSPYFERAIDEQERGEGSKSIYLEEVEFTTLKDFHRWCVNETPSIPDDITPSALLDLGIFAAKYEVYALEHQVVDKFHEKLHDRDSRDKWVLRADTVALVYRQFPQSACVRQVFRDALNSFSPRQLQDEWDEWSRFSTMGCGGPLLDLLKIMTNTAVALSSPAGRIAHYRSTHSSHEPCKFHNHSRQGFVLAKTEGGFGVFLKPECPFHQIECFPNKTEGSSNTPAVEDGEAVTPLDRGGPAATPEDVTGILEETLASAAAEEISCDESATEAVAVCCDEPDTSPEEEVPATVEMSQVDDTPEPQREPEECVDYWVMSKESKKDKKGKKKKGKGKSFFYEEAPVEEALVEEALVEEALVEEALVEEALVEEALVEEALVEEAPVEEAPAEEAPVSSPLMDEQFKGWERLR